MKSTSKTRTTLRMNPALKVRLEEIARSEGTTVTDLIHEASWSLVRNRECPSPVVEIDLPVVSLADGRTLDPEEIKLALHESEDEYDRRQARLAMGLDS